MIASGLFERTRLAFESGAEACTDTPWSADVCSTGEQSVELDLCRADDGAEIDLSVEIMGSEQGFLIRPYIQGADGADLAPDLEDLRLGGNDDVEASLDALLAQALEHLHALAAWPAPQPPTRAAVSDVRPAAGAERRGLSSRKGRPERRARGRQVDGEDRILAATLALPVSCNAESDHSWPADQIAAVWERMSWWMRADADQSDLDARWDAPAEAMAAALAAEFGAHWPSVVPRLVDSPAPSCSAAIRIAVAAGAIASRQRFLDGDGVWDIAMSLGSHIRAARSRLDRGP